MRDTIYRDDAIWVASGYCHPANVAKELAKLPSAEPQERKTGRWNVYCHTPKDFSYSCNQCGYSAPYGLYGGEYSQKKWNFCPNCGARMEETDG